MKNHSPRLFQHRLISAPLARSSNTVSKHIRLPSTYLIGIRPSFGKSAYCTSFISS